MNVQAQRSTASRVVRLTSHQLYMYSGVVFKPGKLPGFVIQTQTHEPGAQMCALGFPKGGAG